jgi:hypothetical protein
MRIGLAPKCPRSAYSASAPVIVRNTADSAMKVQSGCSNAKASAWRGSSAPSTSGERTMLTMPRIAITANHSTITGPNNAPTFAVPLRWMKKSPIRITSAAGTTMRSSAGSMTVMPSTADSTEIAGVMIASP